MRIASSFDEVRVTDVVVAVVEEAAAAAEEVDTAIIACTWTTRTGDRAQDPVKDRVAVEVVGGPR